MKVRVNPLVSILLFIAASSLLLYLLQRRQTRTNQPNAARSAFVKTSINGRLIFKSLRLGVQSIRVDNDTQTFRFKPELSAGGAFFHAHTEEGDSIIKQAGATDILVKNNSSATVFATIPVE